MAVDVILSLDSVIERTATTTKKGMSESTNQSTQATQSIKSFIQKKRQVVVGYAIRNIRWTVQEFVLLEDCAFFWMGETSETQHRERKRETSK